ncbi:hypothetical protein BDV95DRAFT_320326 [Massariosphaeria phaeospora]|uniref:Uncharacterized protein n=1 Tax=Massariosphaeria phaeospora TaxID=100035 RepID=A0A7C8IH30_9PLEO|nr:hypothetical protein BDV95DRAFT_320326 [Massariosphaeria phaeospora]
MAATKPVSPLQLVHSARVFLGPDDSGFDSERIWILMHKGERRVRGTIGLRYYTPTSLRQDEKLLSGVLAHAHRDHIEDIMDHLTEHGDRELPPIYNSYIVEVLPVLTDDTPEVWTVDFDQNRIFYDKHGLHLMYDFTLPSSPIRLYRFKHYTPLPHPIRVPKPSPTMHSLDMAPLDVIPQQLFDLVYRLVSDYHNNWTTAGFTTEDYGLQHLAMGILSCFTLNFTTQAVCSENLHLPSYRDRASPENLLRWRVWPTPPITPAVSLGSTHILFTDRMEEATSLVYEHFTSRVLSTKTSNPLAIEAIYIITSLSELQYFRKTSTTICSTPAIPFLSAAPTTPPSKTAVCWLLNAIHGHAHPLTTPIHRLPLELHDLILQFACANLIDRAVIAALLDIGVPFAWKSAGKPLRTLPLTPNRNLTLDYSEHQVMFWDTYVGMTYQVQDCERSCTCPGDHVPVGAAG